MANISFLPPYKHFTEDLLDKKNKIVMDWSAKGGCTLIIKMFFNKMGVLEDALSYDPWIHEYRMKIFYRKNGYVTNKILNNPDYYKFKVVRNPYKRVVSSYFNAVHLKDKQFQKFLGNKSIEEATFRDFVIFLRTVDLYKCNIHYKKQRRIFEEEGFKFNRICKLENIDEEIEKVNEDTGMDYIVKGMQSDHYLKRNLELRSRVADTPCSKVRNNAPDYKYFYGKHLVKQVYDIYKDDIEEYGYTFDLGDVGQDSRYSK